MSQENDAIEPISEDEALFRQVTAKLLDIIRDQSAETDRGSGKTVRISLDIPVEYMTVFAWIHYHRTFYDTDKWDPRELASLFPLPEKHKRPAKTYISEILDMEFYNEYRRLREGESYLLRSYKANIAPSRNPDLDDGIPF